jgi:hypothetical protein
MMLYVKPCKKRENFLIEKKVEDIFNNFSYYFHTSTRIIGLFTMTPAN